MLRLFPLLFALLAQPAAAEPMAVARARHEAAVAVVEGLAGEQARLRALQEVLAGQIAALKAGDRAVLPGVTDGALDVLLKEAHEVASRLEAQDRRVAQAERDEAAERARLLAALDAALAAESGELSKPDADRRGAFERMKVLVAERGRLLAAAAVESRRVIELPAVQEGTSPDELRALADEATDNAERVQTQLTALEARLQSLQTRRRVLRAAVAFERDAALFAEDERTRRLVRSEQPVAGVATPRPQPGRGDSEESPALGAPGRNTEDPAPPPAGGGGGFDGPDPPTDEDGPPDLETTPEVVDDGPTGTVAPGPAGVEGAGSVVVETALDPALLAEDVEALSPAAVAEQIRAVEQRRAALKKTADDLEKRRARLEAQARTLESE